MIRLLLEGWAVCAATQAVLWLVAGAERGTKSSEPDRTNVSASALSTESSR